MKSFIVATAFALASVATAQLEDVPTCAAQCLVTPLTTDGCASLDDFKCHCEQADALFASVVPCVQGACSPEDQQSAISIVESTCASAGVPVEVPEQPGASSAAPEPSAAPTEEPMMTATVPASVTVYVPSGMPSGIPTPAPNGTAPVPTPTPSEFPGAAAKVTQAAGLLGAVALALLAL